MGGKGNKRHIYLFWHRLSGRIHTQNWEHWLPLRKGKGRVRKGERRRAFTTQPGAPCNAQFCFPCPPALSSPQEEEETGFTGRRMNSKMQVYSGSKCAYLPKMMTLHQQCIRVLKNNIDCKSHAFLLLLSPLWHWGSLAGVQHFHL